MVFNSYIFLIFFAVVWGLHQLPFPWAVKKFNLLVASYVFYAAWSPPFVLLLILSAVVDFFLARWMGRIDAPSGRRLLLGASLAVNLGLLGYFKYGSFLLENFVRAAALLGIHYQPPAGDIILPLGISFYTFETISYLMDVYRRRIKPWGSFLDYALFLTFFPHLVAGPIVRAADFLPQCVTPRRATDRQIGWGLCLLVLGLFEKVVLADGLLAPVVDKVYNATAAAHFGDAWAGTLAFSGQIFFDFAGYTTCAIGVALCFGFVLNDNFHFPYAAVGFSDFWRRWHMSLSGWLRDYLHIPLGGNRKGLARTNVNLMLTMLLGGL
jgi:D-alanyl-lipoteichoic acid acyltransferase DltB (MBOAT superfamily)